MGELNFNTPIAHFGCKVTCDIVMSSSSAGKAIEYDLYSPL